MISDSRFRKFLFMTLVVIGTAGILGVAGFYLWFLFPVIEINGLTYMSPGNLVTYYCVINILDVAGVNLFARILYFNRVKTASPFRDGLLIGGYLLVFCWVTDILVYVFVRNTLPTIQEYFLGKNQPEIGIAWIIGFGAAAFAGWLEQQRREASFAAFGSRAFFYISVLALSSILLTVVGIIFFDIRP